MEEYLAHLFAGSPGWALWLVIAASILVLAKGADLLVEEAVALSLKWRIPKAIIGATIVSLGTTTPEVTVSVMAALEGSPGLALGNAAGSIICDTGLILGLALLIRPIDINPQVVNRQGWIQFGSALLLVAACVPFGSAANVFVEGGRLPQEMGWVFLVLLAGYIGLSIFWSLGSSDGLEAGGDVSAPVVQVLGKLVVGVVLVVLSSQVLIGAAEELAMRLKVPEAVIAATLVAFGTSLPELVTTLTATIKGHGQLGVGNIIGADILNVFFVAGTAAAVTAGGLETPASFFRVLFPALILMMLVFRTGILVSPARLTRPFGAVLLGIYIVTTIVIYRV